MQMMRLVVLLWSVNSERGYAVLCPAYALRSRVYFALLYTPRVVKPYHVHEFMLVTRAFRLIFGLR